MPPTRSVRPSPPTPTPLCPDAADSTVGAKADCPTPIPDPFPALRSVRPSTRAAASDHKRCCCSRANFAAGRSAKPLGGSCSAPTPSPSLPPFARPVTPLTRPPPAIPRAAGPGLASPSPPVLSPPDSDAAKTPPVGALAGTSFAGVRALVPELTARSDGPSSRCACVFLFFVVLFRFPLCQLCRSGWPPRSVGLLSLLAPRGRAAERRWRSSSLLCTRAFSSATSILLAGVSVARGISADAALCSGSTCSARRKGCWAPRAKWPVAARNGRLSALLTCPRHFALSSLHLAHSACTQLLSLCARSRATCHLPASKRPRRGQS